MKILTPYAILALSGLALSAQAGPDGGSHSHGAPAPAADSSDINSLTGENATFYGFSPNFYLLGGAGISSADQVGDLATSHHDPNDDYTLQALEFALSARLGEYIEAQFNHAVFTELEDGSTHFHNETEELFLKLVNLPGGFEVRGGQFLNRFGFQNARHNHAWEFANQNLSNGHILQEGELTTIGTEVTWNLPTPFPAAFSVYAGNAPEHAEEMAPGPPPLFEGHEGELDEDIIGANLLLTHNLSDFHQFAGTASVTHGQNHFETNTLMAGLGLQYQWRENGLEPGGRSLTLRGEVVGRSFKAFDSGAGTTSDDIEQAGGYFAQIYEHNEHWVFANRFGYVTGRDDAELTERFRATQAVTWYANEARNFFTRLQVDNDWLDGAGHEVSAWFQIGMHWGPGGEVR